MRERVEVEEPDREKREREEVEREKLNSATQFKTNGE